jgi:hypothetical protein
MVSHSFSTAVGVTNYVTRTRHIRSYMTAVLLSTIQINKRLMQIEFTKISPFIHGFNYANFAYLFWKEIMSPLIRIQHPHNENSALKQKPCRPSVGHNHYLTKQFLKRDESLENTLVSLRQEYSLCVASKGGIHITIHINWKITKQFQVLVKHKSILTSLLTYLLTYSMEQSPSWEANSKLCS